VCVGGGLVQEHALRVIRLLIRGAGTGQTRNSTRVSNSSSIDHVATTRVFLFCSGTRGIVIFPSPRTRRENPGPAISYTNFSASFLLGKDNSFPKSVILPTGSKLPLNLVQTPHGIFPHLPPIKRVLSPILFRIFGQSSLSSGSVCENSGGCLPVFMI